MKRSIFELNEKMRFEQSSYQVIEASTNLEID
jgi:hypothetical protein